MGNIAVVLPCKNEEQAIGDVLAAICGSLETAGHTGSVYVINDHSTDGTLEAATEFAQFRSAESPLKVAVINSSEWPGKTSAQALGLASVKGAFDYVAFMDSDGQHRATDLLALIEQSAKTASVVFGVRSQQYKRPSTSALGVTALDGIKKVLGLEAKSELSEFVVLPKVNAQHLRRSPNLGIAPLSTAIVSLGARYFTHEIVVDSRIGIQKTNFSSRSLFRKALYEILSEPWVYLPRVFAAVCLLTILFTGYGLFIGISQVLANNQNGVASIIILQVVFAALNAVLLLVVLGVITLFIQSQQRASLRPGAAHISEDF